MKKRNILFGYQYQDGVITLHPQEVIVIKRIFSEYMSGLSLLEIADQLNAENVEYQPGVTGWNKSRIMRLIEDKKYAGNGGFPAIIDEETHQALLQLKSNKNTQHSTDRSAEIFHIDVPVICPICGNEMNRRHDSRFQKCNQRWLCSNADCHTVIHKPDEELLTDITIVLNQAIVNPEIIQIPVTSDTAPSVQVRKMENEIGRQMDSPDRDKSALQKMMFECVSLKYADIDSAPHIAQRLKAALANAGPLSNFSMAIFKKAVKEIYLERDGAVSIKLINNQVVGKDDEHGTDDGNAQESGSQNPRQSEHS